MTDLEEKKIIKTIKERLAVFGISTKKDDIELTELDDLSSHVFEFYDSKHDITGWIDINSSETVLELYEEAFEFEGKEISKSLLDIINNRLEFYENMDDSGQYYISIDKKGNASINRFEDDDNDEANRQFYEGYIDGYE